MNEEKLEYHRRKLEEAGAVRTAVIVPKSVVTAPWTVFKCQYGCDGYGASHCCPPRAPSHVKTREILDSYQTGILFLTHEWNATEMAREAAKRLFLDDYYKAIAFGSGPCRICEKCNLERCNFPEKAIPAMEACGIDVYATARENGFEIHVLKTMGEERNHFGLVLVE